MKKVDKILDKRTVGGSRIVLLAVAFLIGTYSILKYNAPAAFIYFFSVLVGYLLSLYFFCRKCPHIADNSCRFAVIRKIVYFFPKNRVGESYSCRDVFIIWIPRLFMFFFPRPWLYENKILFIVFWVLIIGALCLYWVAPVCQTCRNEKCPSRRMIMAHKKITETTECTDSEVGDAYDVETGKQKEWQCW